MADDRYQDALREIARIAGAALSVDGSTNGSAPPAETGQEPGCRVMALPARLRDKAAEVAVRENPVNNPNLELMSIIGAGPASRRS